MIRTTSYLLVICMASACAGDASSSSTVAAVRDSSGVQIIERSALEMSRLPAWRLASKPSVTLGASVFPATLPAFDQMLLDRQGLLWLRRTATEDDRQAEWVVVQNDGALVARVEMPAALTPHDIDEGSVLGVWTDELQREQIRRYSLNR